MGVTGGGLEVLDESLCSTEEAELWCCSKGGGNAAAVRFAEERSAVGDITPFNGEASDS